MPAKNSLDVLPAMVVLRVVLDRAVAILLCNAWSFAERSNEDSERERGGREIRLPTCILANEARLANLPVSEPGECILRVRVKAMKESRP